MTQPDVHHTTPYVRTLPIHSEASRKRAGPESQPTPQPELAIKPALSFHYNPRQIHFLRIEHLILTQLT